MLLGGMEVKATKMKHQGNFQPCPFEMCASASGTAPPQ